MAEFAYMAHTKGKNYIALDTGVLDILSLLRWDVLVSNV